MTDLTEQWKKGELQEGFYYVRCAWSDEVEIRYVHNGVDDWQEIVAPVPSYEEWEKLNWYAGNGVEENQTLKMENAKLKELLSETLDVIEENSRLSEIIGRKRVLPRNEGLIKRIKEVLK